MAERRPASKLRLARIAQGWRITDLATEAGISRSCLWRLETGHRRNPSNDTRKAVASALGMPATELFGG